MSNPQAVVFVPDGKPPAEALARTTHLGIGAHPDDLEFMCWHPILTCFSDADQWFTGVIATDGRASPRTGRYAGHSDEAMVAARLKEQHHAAVTGEYSAAVSLMHSERGQVMTGPELMRLADDFYAILKAAAPRFVYTHNPADRHEHHIAVVVALVEALRRLEPELHPESFYGCEVWRGLDWLSSQDRLTFDVSEHQNLTAALMGVYDSQITGGKRYDLATAGRKRANATYNDPYSADEATALEFAVDLSPLLRRADLTLADYLEQLVERFRLETLERVQRFTGLLTS